MSCGKKCPAELEAIIFQQAQHNRSPTNSSDRIIGCDVTIYNPDMDPAGRHAKRIVRFIADAIKSAH